MVAEKKESVRNQEGCPIYIPPLPNTRILDSNKDIWMDLNQVYNFIWIGFDNPKRTQGSQIVPNM